MSDDDGSNMHCINDTGTEAGLLLYNAYMLICLGIRNSHNRQYFGTLCISGKWQYDDLLCITSNNIHSPWEIH